MLCILYGFVCHFECNFVYVLNSLTTAKPNGIADFCDTQQHFLALHFVVFVALLVQFLV